MPRGAAPPAPTAQEGGDVDGGEVAAEADRARVDAVHLVRVRVRAKVRVSYLTLTLALTLALTLTLHQGGERARSQQGDEQRRQPHEHAAQQRRGARASPVQPEPHRGQRLG